MSKDRSLPPSPRPRAKSAKGATKHPAAGGRSKSVVGIGASAGGLEALEVFLGGVACLPGAAFVVVQHLSTSQPSLLPELLQRVTDLPVETIEHGMPLRAGTVYVAPPGPEVQLGKNGFALVAQEAAPAPRLPIDSFFRSLAGEYREAAIGVILSGMGCDGTLGLGAIKEQGGATFVQLPETAQFDSMPRNALQAGVADVSAAVSELPARIAEYLAHVARPSTAIVAEPEQGQAIESIIATLRSQTGHDFASYKKSTLHRRIERRMALHHRRSLADYGRMLRQNKIETELLFKELLIGVTSFFRDPQVWEHLRDEVLPGFLASRGNLGPLRIWVPGCSTGEEVYTLAMVLAEAIELADLPEHPTFKIFATDIDRDAIDRARAARYPLSIADTLSPERLERFFVRDDTGFQIHKNIRETVIFALQNVAMDPPFTKLDMLVCRNLLIYFEATLQRKLLPLFHYSLEPGGLLLLGTAETTGPAVEYFAPLPGRFKLYRRLETFRSSGFVAFPATFERHTDLLASEHRHQPTNPDDSNLQRLADHLLLQRYSPAAVLVTKDGDVLYISGRTGKYLEPAAGRANWNVFAMARDGLGRPLGAAFKEAVREQHSVTMEGSVLDLDHGELRVRITVDPITSPKLLVGMVMIVFADRDVRPQQGDAASSAGDAPPLGRRRPGSRELVQLREALRAARDEAQNAEEQSRASSEELQSTNEELQSTNEELTTSKEELQSMNEELQTVNQELQAKVDELSQASDDMRNLLNSTEIATLFLDERLRIRRYTSQSVSIFKLIPTDIGRPITDITNALEHWNVADDAAQVLSSLVPKEKEVRASGERWFKVRMMSYRTSNNRIDGVVITLSDISGAKLLESRLTKAKGELEKRLQHGSDGAKPVAATRAPTTRTPAPPESDAEKPTKRARKR